MQYQSWTVRYSPLSWLFWSCMLVKTISLSWSVFISGPRYSSRIGHTLKKKAIDWAGEHALDELLATRSSRTVLNMCTRKGEQKGPTSPKEYYLEHVPIDLRLHTCHQTSPNLPRVLPVSTKFVPVVPVVPFSSLIKPLNTSLHHRQNRIVDTKQPPKLTEHIRTVNHSKYVYIGKRAQSIGGIHCL